MRRTIDEDGIEWEEYSFKSWSLVSLVPLVSNLVQSLPGRHFHVQWPGVAVMVGVLVFLLSNLEYALAIRGWSRAGLERNEVITKRSFPKVWIRIVPTRSPAPPAKQSSK